MIAVGAFIALGVLAVIAYLRPASISSRTSIDALQRFSVTPYTMTGWTAKLAFLKMSKCVFDALDHGEGGGPLQGSLNVRCVDDERIEQFSYIAPSS